jgi:hypothetical protein
MRGSEGNADATVQLRANSTESEVFHPLTGQPTVWFRTTRVTTRS